MRALALILAAALALPDPASAAILFASGEDSGFTAIGAAIIFSGTAGRFRAGYPRGVIAASTNSGAVDPPANRMQSSLFAAGNLVWIHAQVWDGATAQTLNQQGIIARSPDGVSRIVVRQTATYGILKVSTRNAAGTITDLATASAPALVASTVTSLDIKIDYSATGGVQMWLGGTQVINFAGDPRTDAATQLNQVEIANITGITNWSEIIVADQDTRAMGLVTLPVVLAGNTQGWTGGTQTAINENPLNDASFLSDGTGNVLSQWTTTVTMPAPQILAIVQEARVRKGGTGPSAFDWSVRTGSVDYLAGTTTALTTTFANYANQQWLTNPGTGTAWVPTDITGGTLNLGVKSLP